MTAHTDVRVMQLNPPSGYTFLGYVAVVGYHSLPRTDAYRYCITYGFNKHAFKMHNAISNNNWFGTPCPTRNTNVSQNLTGVSNPTMLLMTKGLELCF